MSKKAKLQVRLLGGFSATYKGTELADSKHSVSQYISLLQLMFHFHEVGVSRNIMKEALLGDREVDDAQHAIRNIIYNAKKRLKAAGLPEADYITSSKGVYYWTPEIPVSCDTEDLEHLYELAQEEPDDTERLNFLKDAVHKYNGEFMGGQNIAPWAVREGARLRDVFRKCVNEAADIMRSNLSFKDLQVLGEYAANVDPFAEWEVLIVEAVSAQGRYKEAEELCDATLEKYINEHGLYDAAYVRELSNRFSAGMNRRTADLESIQSDLASPTKESRGGFYCSYPVFQEVYRTLGRMMERYADRFFLMLCTVVDSKGNPMEDGPRLAELSARLRDAIIGSIRHSDSAAKYGSGQYLVLLTNTSREDCEIVRKRIDRNFMLPGQRTGVEYEVNYAIITDVPQAAYWQQKRNKK